LAGLAVGWAGLGAGLAGVGAGLAEGLAGLGAGLGELGAGLAAGLAGLGAGPAEGLAGLGAGLAAGLEELGAGLVAGLAGLGAGWGVNVGVGLAGLAGRAEPGVVLAGLGTGLVAVSPVLTAPRLVTGWNQPRTLDAGLSLARSASGCCFASVTLFSSGCFASVALLSSGACSSLSTRPTSDRWFTLGVLFLKRL